MTTTPTPLLPTYAPRSYLSYSTLLSFIRCPRKYFYQKCGIYPREEASALHYGSAMHKAIAFASQGNFDAALSAFQSLWTPEHEATMSDSKRSLTRAKAQLSHFCHTHRDGRSIYTMLPPPTPPLVVDEERSPFELQCVLDIGLPIPLVAYLDGWCEHRDTKERYAYEFKSTSRLSASLFDGLDLNPQILSYALICRSATSANIQGVMFEAMLIDPKKVDNLTHPVPIPDHLVSDILLWLRYWGELLLACEAKFQELKTINGVLSLRAAAGMEAHLHDAARAFPKNFAGCSSYPLFYMSGSHCEYTNLCRTSNWKSMLPYFEIRPEHKLIELTNSTQVTKVVTA